jgi:hypothetical protein
MFVFEGHWTPANILDGAPPGSRVSMQESGYFEKVHLLSVFKHIMAYIDEGPDKYHIVNEAGQSERRPVLLILDGATVHFSSEALQYAVDNKMTVLRLPAHVTHIMQVSDVGVFASFKLEYSKACDEWRETHKGNITKYHIAAIVGKAWGASVTAENVKSGFRKTGQYPYNPIEVLKQVAQLQSCTSPVSVVS